MKLVSLARRLMLVVQRVEVMPWTLRRLLLRAAGADIAPDALVVGGVTVIGHRLVLARGAFVNNGVLLDCHGGVSIGENVHVAPRAVILTSTHAMGAAAMRAGEPSHWPVTIEAGCWIGAGATILPGVTVAQGSIVGAGALVTRDTEPDGLYLGNPARRRRDLDAN